MKSRIKIILFLILSLCLARVSYAQDARVSSRADDFDKIKSEITGLLEANKKLEIEHSLLQKEYEHLQELIKLKEKEKKELGIGASKQAYSPRPKSDKHSISAKTLSDKGNQLLLEESRNSYLAKQSIDSELSGSLWMLKLSDLQYQKRALEMELELQSLKLQDNTGKDQKALRKMSLEIKQNTEKKKQAEAEISRMQNNAKDFGEETRSLAQENGGIKHKSKKLQKELDIIQRENKILNKKLIYADKSVDLMFGDRNEERTSLEEVVRDLESEYKKLSEGINNTLSAQEKKREYMQEVVKIDKENVKLREQIASLKQKIKEMR